MKFLYRTEHNARAISAFWNKPLDKAEWYSIKAATKDGDPAEIFIHDVVGWPWNDVNMLVREMAMMKDTPILARINSPGGDFFDGLNLANAFANHPAGVTTRIESLAASVSSLMAVSGKVVEAYSNTLLMIHNAWTIAMVDEVEAFKVGELLKKIDTNMVASYTAKTKTGKKEMAQMMADETWMTASEAKDKGFIDTILVSGKGVKAEFDLSVFANLPEQFNPESTTEPTIRDYEKALREAGASRSEAKAILARGMKAEAIDPIIEPVVIIPPQIEDNTAFIAAIQSNINKLTINSHIGGN